MLDSPHRVTGTKDSDWEISYEGTKERYERGLEEMRHGIWTGRATAMYSRIFFPDGSGDHDSNEQNKGLGLPMEELDVATRRTVEMVDSGWNSFAEIDQIASGPKSEA